MCRELVRQHHASHTMVQRAKLALLLAESPAMTTSDLARRLGAGTSFVWVWRKRWALFGFTLEDRPRSGRPRRAPKGEVQQTVPAQDPNSDNRAVGA